MRPLGTSLFSVINCRCSPSRGTPARSHRSARHRSGDLHQRGSNIGGLRDQTKFGSWLFGIAHQRCAQQFRRQQRVDALFTEMAPDGDDPNDVTPDPCAALLQKEQAETVLALVDRLPVPQKSALLLHVLEGSPSMRSLSSPVSRSEQSNPGSIMPSACCGSCRACARLELNESDQHFTIIYCTAAGRRTVRVPRFHICISGRRSG